MHFEQGLGGIASPPSAPPLPMTLDPVGTGGRTGIFKKNLKRRIPGLLADLSHSGIEGISVSIAGGTKSEFQSLAVSLIPGFPGLPADHVQTVEDVSGNPRLA